MSDIKNYLQSAEKQFQYYKLLAEKTFEQLSEEELFRKPHEDGNSIAMIVNHISGNMLSRWTDFLTTDGEKEWRNRDQEFEDIIKTKAEMLKKWEKGWACLFDALRQIDEANFGQIIYIRNQGHTITEAINRQLGHYPYHIGQIVFLGKMLKAASWKSLTVPKGQSEAFNKEKFAQAKQKKHFTDSFVRKWK